MHDELRGTWNQSVARTDLWSRLWPETAFWTAGQLYRQGKMEADLELIHVKLRANIQLAGTLEQIGLRGA
ncbi:MAG TPA: hypothetical protein VLS26_10135 [Azonexus sp.]|nr:hypothetical protein [Azonexus sp.]